MDLKLPMDGACRCGRVRVRVSAAPLMAMACHCRGCQTMTGSAFSLSLIIPKGAFEVLQGETELGGEHRPQAQHHHCTYCKTWMFTRRADVDMTTIRPSILDDHNWFRPFADTQTDEKLPWAVTGAPHAYAKYPPPQEFGPLIGAYADWFASL